MKAPLWALASLLALTACSSAEPGGSGGTGANSGGTGATEASGTGGASSSLPSIGGCSVFTNDDDWNKDISAAPVDSTWTQRIHNIVGNIDIHPDYGGAIYGIPVNVVPRSQPMVAVTFDEYPTQSDPGPYPFPSPSSAKVEGASDPTTCSGDCHLLVVQQGTCMLYEGYYCQYQNGWRCGNGAKWDLTKKSYGQRPVGWTSADAAGLPIMTGLVRYAEVESGAIHHAIRFTLECSLDKYVEPATHFAASSGCGTNAPPMGLRVRLRADYDISGLPHGAQVVLTAMKKYGMILADNGSDFFFQGEENPNWSDADIAALKTVPASAFEVIRPGPLGP